MTNDHSTKSHHTSKPKSVSRSTSPGDEDSEVKQFRSSTLAVGNKQGAIPLDSNTILHLQQMIGNQAVQRMLAGNQSRSDKPGNEHRAMGSNYRGISDRDAAKGQPISQDAPSTVIQRMPLTEADIGKDFNIIFKETPLIGTFSEINNAYIFDCDDGVRRGIGLHSDHLIISEHQGELQQLGQQIYAQTLTKVGGDRPGNVVVQVQNTSSRLPRTSTASRYAEGTGKVCSECVEAGIGVAATILGHRLRQGWGIFFVGMGSKSGDANHTALLIVQNVAGTNMSSLATIGRNGFVIDVWSRVCTVASSYLPLFASAMARWEEEGKLIIGAVSRNSMKPTDFFAACNPETQEIKPAT
jgi:hypothetical protein